MSEEAKTGVAIILGVLLLVAVVVGVPLFAWPHYRVWERKMQGEAELAQAQQNRQIAISEAEAKKEAATLLADAEVERAKGVAEANQIIGSSLDGNEAYLRYLWIDKLSENGNDVIYVPTEAGIPILEAGKRKSQPDEQP